MKHPCQISFIAVNYGGLRDTVAMVESIRSTVRSVSYEIIVVDNGSPGDDATELQRRLTGVKVIVSPRNLGFAGGNNLALPEAEGEFFFFINNDTEIAHDGFDALIAHYREHPGLVSPKIRYHAEPDVIQYAGFTPLSRITLRNRGIGYGERDCGQYDAARPTAYIHGAAMMVSRQVLDAVGPMWEGFFLYYEEMDWCERMRSRGYEIWYDPCCTILHKESRSTGKGSPLQTYCLTRNRLLYACRHRRGLTRLLSLAYLTMVSLLRLCSCGSRPLALAIGRAMLFRPYPRG